MRKDSSTNGTIGLILKTAPRVVKMIWECSPSLTVSTIVLSIVTVLLPVAAAWYSSQFINLVTTETISSLIDPRLFRVLVFFIGLEILNPIFQATYNYIDKRFILKFDEYRANIFHEKRLSIDIQTYEDPAFNNLVSRVNENQWKLWQYSYNIVSIVQNIIGFIIGAGILVVANPLYALGIFVALIPDLYVEVKYGKDVWSIWDAKSEIKRRYFEFLDHFKKISSLIEIKIFQLKQYFLGTTSNLLAEANREIYLTDSARFKLKFITTLLSFSIQGVIIVLLVRDVVFGTILVGTFVFLLGRIVGFHDQLSRFFSRLGSLSQDSHFIRDTIQFLDTKPAIMTGTKILDTHTPKISFENVSFEYPGTNKTILNNISITLNPGTKLAIVGVNGAGKTTFTKLLTRMYDPTEGLIVIDDTPLTEIDLGSYHQKIGLLSQDYARYKVPVYELISFGNINGEIDEDRMLWAAQQSGADEFIRKLPYGYKTQLGKEFDGGIEPSVGQWQKLALARMFYRNPNIWILDEPTASIDAIAELQIFNKLDSLPKDRTVILISHRFNTVKNVDRIIVIDDCKIIEDGSHMELVALNGHYAKLFSQQKDSYN